MNVNILNASEYYNELSTEDKERYLSKVKCISYKDPYALVPQNFINIVTNIPQITENEISEYLLFRASPFTHQQMRAHKSLAAFTQVVCNWIKDVKLAKFNDHYLFIGKVLHSERLNLQPLMPWVILSKDGKIAATHCTCKAGLGEACVHIAAVLYSLLTRKPNESVTDRLAYWVAPTPLQIHLPVEEIDFRSPKSLWKKSIRTKNVHKLNKKKIRDSETLTKQDVMQFLKEYKEAGCVSALYKIVKPFTSEVTGKS